MTFDPKLSTTVSLSRILDSFLEEEENPSTVLSFLELNKKDIADIIKWSDHSSRLFSIGFIQRCSFDEVQQFCKILSPLVTHYSTWLELRRLDWMVRVSNLDISTKNVFKSLNFDNVLQRSAKHPHAGHIGADFEGIDTLLLRCNQTADDIAEILNSIRFESFERFLVNITHSLYCFRICQSDVISKLEPDKLYIFTNWLKHNTNHTYLIYKGLKELIVSPILIPDVRLEILKNIASNYSGSLVMEILDFPDEIENLMTMSSSFTQFLMKMQLIGNSGALDWVLFPVAVNFSIPGSQHRDLFTKDRKTTLDQIVKKHEKIFKEYFDITDLFIDEPTPPTDSN